MIRSTPARAAAALVSLLLAACATLPAPVSAPSADAKRRAAFDKSLDSWTGAKVQELIAKLGQPTAKTRQADGAPVYVYAKSAKSGATTTFSCVVRYVLDARSERVTGHQIEGC